MTARAAAPALLALALVLPNAAAGATVEVIHNPFDAANDVLSYTADPGEVNVVTVSGESGAFLVVDTAAPLVAGEGCEAAGPGAVRCQAERVAGVTGTLGDRDDRFRMDDSAHALVPDRDVIEAFSGLVSGEDGDDELVGGIGADRFEGGAGSDVLEGGPGDDVMAGGGEFGQGEGSAADHDVVRGGDGSDFMFGGPGADELDGGAGRDDMTGGEGGDVMRAGPGDDPFLIGDAGDDVVDGGPGNETLIWGGPGDDTLLGGDGDDAIGADPAVGAFADAGRDVIDGGPGDDVLGSGLDAGAGGFTIGGGSPPAILEADELRGGDGFDTVTYEARDEPVTVDLDGAADDGGTGEGDLVASDVERLVGGNGPDTIAGSGAGNVLDGGRGDDVLDGGGGDDTLAGGVNDDGSDTLLGGGGADLLRAGPGDDALDGGDGADTLAGGGGSDTADGGEGDDTAAGGPGLDAVAGGAGNDTLRGADEILVGADGTDELDGGAGDDLLLGGPGDDQLDGGAGADRIAGEAGRDTVSYADRADAVAVTLGPGAVDGGAGANDPVAVTLGPGALDGAAGENDAIGGDVEAVRGGSGDDDLTGDAGANRLEGGTGDDALDGGRGRDALDGGRGADVVRSRDGLLDDVACGADGDFAIADPADVVRDCEIVDRGGPRRRLPASGLELRPGLAGARVRLPSMLRSFVLRDDVVVPSGSVIAPGATGARIAIAGRRGRREPVTVSGSAVEARRVAARSGALAQLVLTGGDFSGCTGAATVRRLSVRGGRRAPRLRVRARVAVVSGRGGAWAVRDRCDGTLVRVTRGSVVVRGGGRSVRVRAGGRRLVRTGS